MIPDQDRDFEYQAALSQANPSSFSPSSAFNVEASPGTLEAGVTARGGQPEPEQGLVASPFHSDKVRMEVNLIKTRPTTLDADASKLRAEYDDAALGSSVAQGTSLEPDYSLLGAGDQVFGGPRVARVKAVDSRVEEPQLTPDCSLKPETPLISTQGGDGVVTSSDRLDSAVGPRAVPSDAEPSRIAPEDPRELIPEKEDRLLKLEFLLERALDENKELKRRLQSESTSSWHSARTPGELPASPASFAMGQHYANAMPPSMYGVQVDPVFLRDFPNSMGGCCVKHLETMPGASEEQHSLVRARFSHPSPYGFTGTLGADRVQEGTRLVEGFTGVGSELKSEPGFGMRPGPPALPLPLSESRSAPAPDVPASQTQSMRQFAEGVLSNDQASRGFHTPRSTGFDGQGYPVSPGGTVIRPPPGPPPLSPRSNSSQNVGPGSAGLESFGLVPVSSEPVRADVRPEEPAKYISEIPKLVQADLASSAVVCGNWLAQVRQVMVGLSPSATVWWQGVEGPASRAYQKWLVANPLGRLSIDPSSVQGEFDRHLYGRVESRSVSLLLAAVPQTIRDDVVTNRWLASASILFRVLCLFQPGGSSERSHLLSQLVNPNPCKSFSEAVKGLRTWQQCLNRAGEIHATLPDSSLLLRGIDGATAALMSAHPMIGFRVNAFRHQLAIDHNPSVTSVIQLVQLIQAECEAASITADGSADKRARTAALNASREQAGPKAPPVPPPPPNPKAAAVSTGQGEGKEKGKGKGKSEDVSALLCHKFGDSTGCRFGDSCKFKHDRATARKEGRCLACGQKDHYRPDCPLVAPENRVVQEGNASAESSPKAGAPGGKGGRLKGKPKAAAQAKGVTEDVSGSGNEPSGVTVNAATASSSTGPETLIAEAAKLLKGVSIKPLRLESQPVMTGRVDLSCVDASWLLSVTGVSDCSYALVDSGATNALRPAEDSELRAGRVIRVDLASGTAELRINDFGTLLHAGQCQVILPAAYLVDLGFTIAWRKRGCVIRHPKKGRLDVVVVKGCPLIPKEVGLSLLRDYEALKESEVRASKVELRDSPPLVKRERVRGWLRERVQLQARLDAELDKRDQLTYLRSLFPGVPRELLSAACVEPSPLDLTDWTVLPWNRRMRRSIDRSSPGSVLVNCSETKQGWKGLGRVLTVGDRASLDSPEVFRRMLRWASKGVFGGFVYERPARLEPEDWEAKGLIVQLRLLLLYGVSQAVKDGVEVNPSEAADAREGLNDLPEDLTNPDQVALWALKRAAARIEKAKEKKVSEGSTVRVSSAVFLVFGGVMESSPTVGAETVPQQWAQALAGWQDAYGLCRACFDQGCLGAPEPRETELITSSWYLRHCRVIGCRRTCRGI